MPACITLWYFRNSMLGHSQKTMSAKISALIMTIDAWAGSALLPDTTLCCLWHVATFLAQSNCLESIIDCISTHLAPALQLTRVVHLSFVVVTQDTVRLQNMPKLDSRNLFLLLIIKSIRMLFHCQPTKGSLHICFGR